MPAVGRGKLAPKLAGQGCSLEKRSLSGLERREDLRIEGIEMGYRLGFYGLIVAIAVLAAAGLGLGGPGGMSQGIG